MLRSAWQIAASSWAWQVWAPPTWNPSLASSWVEQLASASCVLHRPPSLTFCNYPWLPPPSPPTILPPVPPTSSVWLSYFSVLRADPMLWPLAWRQAESPLDPWDPLCTFDCPTLQRVLWPNQTLQNGTISLSATQILVIRLPEFRRQRISPEQGQGPCLPFWPLSLSQPTAAACVSRARVSGCVALPSESGEVVSPSWPSHSLWLDGLSVGGNQGARLEPQTSFTGTWSCDKKDVIYCTSHASRDRDKRMRKFLLGSQAGFLSPHHSHRPVDCSFPLHGSRCR